MISPSFNFRFAQWGNTEYKLAYFRSTLALEGGGEETPQNNFNQRLLINLSPVKNLKINLTGEHYYIRLQQERSKNLFLADIAASYVINEKYEISGSVTNLLNQTAYVYTLFNELSSVICDYAIRGRSFLLGFYLKF